MSDVKISQLPVVSSVTNSDVLPVVASTTTSQLSIADLATSLPQVSSSISASFALNATSASFASNARSASFALNVPISVSGSTLYSNNPLAGTDFNRTG